MPEHSSDRGKKPNDFLCKIKYKNTLPEIPFDPKTLAYDVDLAKYIAYSHTSLMKQHHWGYYPDTSAVLDLVDIEAWTPDAGNIRGIRVRREEFESFLMGFSSSFGTGH
jgi:RNA polymerase II-associated factor 1